MGESEEIVLSVEETNALRAKLGLKPLRIGGSGDGGGGGGSRGADAAGTSQHQPTATRGTSQSGTSGTEELSLSVDDTNALRAKLGLAPLRSSGGGGADPSGRKASEAVHAPAANLGDEKAARGRVEDARARREAKAGIARLAAKAGLGVGPGVGAGGASDSNAAEDGAASWAAKMRAGKDKDNDDKSDQKKKKASGDGEAKKKKKKKKQSKKGTKRSADANRISVPGDDEEGSQYGAQDLEGMAVGHAADDFEAGTTTVLTLADASLLGGDGAAESGSHVLENANLRDDGVSRDNLRKKREVEMGMGHAGGYAGYDDDEFEEIGGSQAASRLGSGAGAGASGSGGAGDNSGKVGFRIGEAASKAKGGGGDAGGDDKPDLFAAGSGRAISLQTATQKSASDFMTHDEADAMDADAVREREKREKEARKREKKLFKKMQKDKKKKDKKEHKRRRRYEAGDEEDSDNDDDDTGVAGPVAAKNKGGSILDDLEATAHSSIRDGKARDRGSRRRREREGTDDDDVGKAGDAMDVDGDDADKQEALKKKRRKFEEVMEKGNKRTADAFGLSAQAKDAAKKEEGTAFEGAEEDDGEDDAFLNAALAKARRLQRLKKMQAGAGKDSSVPDTDFVRSRGGKVVKGAEAVVQAVQSSKAKEDNNKGTANGTKDSDRTNGGGGVTFEFDETREFTRALRARRQQVHRGVSASARAAGGLKIAQQQSRKSTDAKSVDKAAGDDAMEVGGGEIADNMEELAKEMSDGEDGGGDGGFGSTANSAPVGRGLANVLSMLKQTGEITGKNAGKEELRGRAKDERTYEDYEALNLKQVVKMDQSAMMNEKDREFANREIKLEYRDEHGRLLTRKEAYRQMCYQFHGHGSSKKNEERRLKQIARERAEAAAASRHQGGQGTLGALQATQEATGKAFVVHKTG
mmetsp:Transcript_31371/g.91923  ORF Transcript_31371/g.91923 Transcript_31371/m.91923 type:complete len:924 (+) Transcript_31371:61-2832(+)